MTVFRRSNSVVVLKSGDTLIGNGNEAEYISSRAGTINIIGDGNNFWSAGIRCAEAIHVKGNSNTISVPSNYLNVQGDRCIITSNIHRLTIDGDDNIGFGKVLKSRRVFGRNNDIPQIHVEPPEERSVQPLLGQANDELSLRGKPLPLASPSNIHTILRSNGPVGEFDIDNSLSRNTFRSGSEWIDNYDDEEEAPSSSSSEDSSTHTNDDDLPPVISVETKATAIKLQPRAVSQRVSTLARNARDITHCIARPSVTQKVKPTSDDEEEMAEKTARHALSDSDDSDYESYWPAPSSTSVTHSGKTTSATNTSNASTFSQTQPRNFGSTSMASHFEAKKAAVLYAKFTPATPPSRFSPFKPATFTSTNPSAGQSSSTSSTSWVSRVNQAPPSPSAPAAAVAIERGFVFPTPTNPKPEEDVVAAVGTEKAKVCVICETNMRIIIFYPCRHCISCISCTYEYIDVKNKEVRGRKTIPCPICTGAVTEVFAPIFS
jgi:hypothetical protein